MCHEAGYRIVMLSRWNQNVKFELTAMADHHVKLN
jgi:hypothetical protein